MRSPEERASRTLSHLLRHRPGRYGVTLDRRGWADVGQVLAGLRRVGVELDTESLTALVASGPKRCFELSADGKQLRAAHRHTVDVDLDHPDERPPDVLFQGTLAQSVAAILREGLQPRGRRAVHLTEREDDAREVDARRGRAVVLRIAAGRMAEDGYRFQRSTSGVWLTVSVPPAYVREMPDA